VTAEQQVVVVFDVEAPDLLTAGLAVSHVLSAVPGRAPMFGMPSVRLASWWMPEEPLRSEVCGNDRDPGRLVFDRPEQSRGEQLDAIMRDLDSTTAAWAADGHPYNGPVAEAREAAFNRLRDWNRSFLSAQIGAQS
jgi:hypothetical protein